MSAVQIIESLDITVSDKDLIARLDEYLSATKGGSTKLSVFSHLPGTPIQAKFTPGPGGFGHKPVGRWGVGAFHSGQKAPPLGAYILRIEADKATVWNGESEVWSGSGGQHGLDGKYVVEFTKP